MSHIVTVETKIKDPVAIAATCKRLELPLPTQGTAKLYSGEATGLLVQLPGWQYPVVIDTATGIARYDHYEGRWGDIAILHKFTQLYTVEVAKQEAKKKNFMVTEQELEDGSIRLQIMEGS